MRPHGRANISRTNPRALGICQRCGFMYNHDQLRWQYEYGGMRLINLRFLVCQPCYDTPQIQLRTILIPPDPTPIEFPLPEQYSVTDNPLSGIGYSPDALFVTAKSQMQGSFIGTLLQGGGLAAAFDGAYSQTAANSTIATSSVTKLAKFSAQASPGSTGSTNYIGMNWAGITANGPSAITQTLSYNVASFVLAGPRDATITGSSAGAITFQGSSDGVNWVTLYSTTTVGAVGEVLTSISSNLTTGNFQQHRFTIQGFGAGTTISVAQAVMNVVTTGQNEQ